VCKELSDIWFEGQARRQKETEENKQKYSTFFPGYTQKKKTKK